MPELLQDWVTAQAQRRPEAVAVALKHETLRYGELETIANQLAATLKEAGCRRGDRVGLLMPKSPMAIAAIVGIYKADCVYVPLDPASPAARLSALVRACGARCLLASGVAVQILDDVLDGLPSRDSVAIGWMDTRSAGNVRFTTTFSLEDVRNAAGAPMADRANRGGDAAHILFTSGSTGAPKGVVITHANVIRFVDWAVGHFGTNSADRVSGHPPLHFDLSVFDIFGSFAAGAALHLVPAEVNLLPNKLAEWIRASGITQWFSVPSALQYMARFDVVGFDDFPALKRLLWCGEVLPTASLAYWMKRLPHVMFTNLYGPTETTIASSYYTVPRCPEDDRAAIPIGTACEGEALLVLDEGLRPVPAGEVGELYIRGGGLSPGYWNDPEKTRRAFFTAPGSTDPSDRIYRTGDLARVGDDGLVYFLGRADSQIKSRGYRIELGEIESALNAIGTLAECAVVAVAAGGFENTTICCAYAPRSGRVVTIAELRTQLGKVVPGYMIPSRWMAFRELPKNLNGKIDRRTLKEALLQHAIDADRHS
jgi:amino acid adenylation domain-containing protein